MVPNSGIRGHRGRGTGILNNESNTAGSSGTAANTASIRIRRRGSRGMSMKTNGWSPNNRNCASSPTSYRRRSSAGKQKSTRRSRLLATSCLPLTVPNIFLSGMLEAATALVLTPSWRRTATAAPIATRNYHSCTWAGSFVPTARRSADQNWRSRSSLRYRTPADYAGIIAAPGCNAAQAESIAVPPAAHTTPCGVSKTVEALIAAG